MGLAGSPEFFARLAEVLRREPVDGTVNHLLWAYRQKVLPGLSERTQADYRKRLDMIAKQFGPLSLRAMSSDAIGPHIAAWRDGMASTPRQADYAMQVLSAVLSWGASGSQRKVAKNQALGFERLYHADRREKVWTQDHVDAFLKVAPEPLRRALILAAETGQRQGDLLRLTWSGVKAQHIELRQRKTSVDVAVAISPALRLCLDAAPRGAAVTLLTTGQGLPWDPKGNGFRSAWQDACKAAGVKGVTFHDLRGTFATRRLADGWTPQDVAYCTGHSLRDLGSLDKYIDRKSVAAARAIDMAQRTDRGAK
ncbi:tyrosine-type recombinase/integrase [uncultured Phenylobacterium sp.]|uniref:tyrosine-type recombinase/integrase n=1 Tax=uncultured Phenylobacterium sp. TaxID=349273 RepID=UPI0025FB2605|nr:tyrosine-type recombinase/integrase [uncultured Phenylobacterium sp.]